MLDIKFIIENAHLVKENLKKRFKSDQIWLVDELVEDHAKWKELKKAADDLRHKRNTISLEISSLKKQKKDASRLLKEAADIPGRIKELEEDIRILDEEILKKLYQIPNMLHSSVPTGKDALQNPELKKVGKPKKFNFPLLSHVEIAEKLKIADFDAGREAAGQGFNYLLSELAQLDLALQRYGIDFLLKRKFTPVIPPIMLNKETLSGAVDLSAFEEVVYKVENENLFLIGTAEHALVSMMKNKTFEKSELPLKFCAVTPCFRKEIGAHGVDTKGLFRMHQFNKVEQVVFATKDNSFKLLEELQGITEEFFKSLEIPFRVIEICSGDLGGKFAKQYDIEAWFPRQNEYKEVTSAANCTDYQARRLNIRYADKGNREHVHILNNTMVATSRAMVAILENFQRKDGSIEVPKVLHSYLGFKEIAPKKGAKS